MKVVYSDPPPRRLGRLVRPVLWIVAVAIVSCFCWWLLPSGHGPCLVLLPEKSQISLPRTWTFFAPAAARPEARPSRLDLHELSPLPPAGRVPVGPPPRELDSQLLVKATAPDRQTTASVFYDTNPDFEAFHGDLDAPDTLAGLQKIYRQEVRDAHRGTKFEFDWEPATVSFANGATRFAVQYRRHLPDEADPGTEFRLQLILRNSHAVRLEIKHPVDPSEDPEIPRQLRLIEDSFGRTADH